MEHRGPECAETPVAIASISPGGRLSAAPTSRRRHAVPDRGVEHGDTGHPLAPEPGQDLFVHLQPAEVTGASMSTSGSACRSGGKEPLHHQAMPQREIDAGNPGRIR